jgi:hypothetical protein
VAARLAAGGVLVVAGAMKAAGPPEEFSVILDAYQLVSPETALALAGVLPWAELLVGMALLGGYFTRWASGTTAALFSAYVLSLASVLVRGIDLPNCGWSGGGLHLRPGQTIIMDAALLAACWASYRWGEAHLSLDGWALRGR